jgi:hypothetical protein
MAIDYGMAIPSVPSHLCLILINKYVEVKVWNNNMREDPRKIGEDWMKKPLKY